MIARFTTILSLVPVEPGFVTVAQLADQLESKGMPATRRSIQRELVLLSKVFPIFTARTPKAVRLVLQGGRLVPVLRGHAMSAQQPLWREWTFRGLLGKTWAKFSPCRTYRYALGRIWKPGTGTLVCVGLNPSTADECVDDATIRRLLGYADAWGLGELRMLNLFALRSTDPRGLLSASDPLGPENEATLRETFQHTRGEKLLLAWGADDFLGELLTARARDVAALALRVHGRPECFGLAANRQPLHPLRLRKDLLPKLWTNCISEGRS